MENQSIIIVVRYYNYFHYRRSITENFGQHCQYASTPTANSSFLKRERGRDVRITINTEQTKNNNWIAWRGI